MLKLESAKPYSFEMDGKPYMLQAVAFGSIDDFKELDSIPESEKIDAIKKFISDRCDVRTMNAIGKLAVPDVMALFKDWVGVMPGESPSSLEG